MARTMARGRYKPDSLAVMVNGTALGMWPTPTAQDANGRDRHNQRDGSVRLSLLGQVGGPP